LVNWVNPKGYIIKGFILSVTKAKNEDCIAIVLSPNDIRTYYRFFGARHSILQMGYLVDFEVEGENSHFLPRLRSLSHLAFDWLYDKNKLLLWHNFIKRFQIHLKDAQELESFYFDLLLDSAQKWNKQNPKRIVCEAYLKLLKYEGRFGINEHCFICEQKLEEEITFMQGFKAVHPTCIYSPSLAKKKILDFFQSSQSIYLEDDEVDIIFNVVIKGF